jgi:hypothetical protein
MEHDMELLACNPAWQGGTRAKEASGSGTLDLGPVINETDRDMWLIFCGTPGLWKIPDGLSDRMVDMPNLPDGWKLWTDPQVRTLEFDTPGIVPAWPNIMKGVTFTKPLPPRMRKAVMLHPYINGYGEIRVEMVDQYGRPWG